LGPGFGVVGFSSGMSIANSIEMLDWSRLRPSRSSSPCLLSCSRSLTPFPISLHVLSVCPRISRSLALSLARSPTHSLIPPSLVLLDFDRLCCGKEMHLGANRTGDHPGGMVCSSGDRTTTITQVRVGRISAFFHGLVSTLFCVLLLFLGGAPCLADLQS
jgi:hypothetical protein